jgi:hypothetical protein
MPAEIPPPLLLLLHEGGWDEIAMVAVGLLVAYAVIMWTGRRSRYEDEDEEDEEQESDLFSDRPPALHDDPPRPKP